MVLLGETILLGAISKDSFPGIPKMPNLPKVQPGKIHTGMGHFPLPLGPFEVLQMDFIYLSPSHGYKSALVMICMFFQWVEVFPFHRATASAVSKILLEKKFSTWAITSELPSDQETHFTGQIIQSVRSG